MPVSKQKPKANLNRRQQTNQGTLSTIRAIPGMNGKHQRDTYLDVVHRMGEPVAKPRVLPPVDHYQIAVQRAADVLAGRVECLSEEEFFRRLSVGNPTGDSVVDD